MPAERPLPFAPVGGTATEARAEGYGAAVLSVSELIAATRRLIEANLPLAWVGGEISNFTRAASGHCYFVLKDAGAQVRCVFFRNKAALAGFVLRDGLQVEVRAQPTLYEARGEFQLYVEAMRLAGAGALYEQFARLKAALEARGWFAAERKRPLPAFPRAIGIVTSPRAAALRDVLTTLRRRSPHVRVVIYPAAVQGKGAAQEIAQAIRAANARRALDGIDALIVCRGGGSIEDLWSFNEEAVAAAIVESALPVVSGVGHETDFTIADFVADVRAPTPTGAAQLVAPDRDELSATLRNLLAHLRAGMGRRIERDMQRIDYLDRRLQHPAARIRAQRERIAALHQRLARAGAQAVAGRAARLQALEAGWLRSLRAPPGQQPALERAHARFIAAWQRLIEARAHGIERMAGALRHLNPEAVLERGYSIVADAHGKVVQDSAGLAIGDGLRIRFARGQAAACVTATDGDPESG